MTGHPDETRIIECPGCDGEGGHHTLTGYDHRNGEPTGYWTTCNICEGRREVEIEVEPITIEDLPDIEPDIDDAGGGKNSAADNGLRQGASGHRHENLHASGF